MGLFSGLFGSSSTSTYVEQAITSITEVTFETQFECSSKNASKKTFRQRIKNCQGSSVNNISDLKFLNEDQLTSKCMQEGSSNVMTEEDVASVLKSKADTMVTGLALSGATAKSVSDSMISLSSTIHRRLKTTMKRITTELIQFDQSIEGCTVDGDGRASALNNMSNFTIQQARKVTIDAIMRDDNVQAVRKKLTTEVDGSAVAFVEGISLDFSWQFASIAIVLILVGGALGLKYMNRVGIVVKDSIKDPKGVLLLVAGLSGIILVLVVIIRIVFFPGNGEGGKEKE
jgi:hypothetical protein